MQLLTPYLALIEEELKTLTWPQQPVNLYEPCKYILSLGGKRVRPALTLMGHHLFNDSFVKSKHAALCVELFHNFSLIHDDIMDKAPLRRGQPTVHKKWNESIGILSGDVMLVKTYELLHANYEGSILKELLHIYSTTAMQVCEGQQMDMDFELRNNVTVEEYEQMISLKTSVLLGCALKLGAVIAGAKANDADHLYEFGKNLGIAFQLRDDYLDAFGNPEKTGKQPGGDILAGKKTFLVIKANEVASSDHKKLLDELLHSQKEDKVEQVMQLFRLYKMDELIQLEVERFQSIAMNHLHQIDVKVNQKEPLMQLADFLLEREH